ncbi:L,D-transpeptidase [Bdellovibrio sp. 22V]|uniref:L,D-transpeptidase n=1 Tax=Bdellovibrio TaxID=958 RepID=UPI00254397F9|nr:L,D-transpeptidase [Bdellovibrio sp. 22V]WII70574.1 L,D-transpeptidase [Bdellovibrio sp. 22V]
MKKLILILSILIAGDAFAFTRRVKTIDANDDSNQVKMAQATSVPATPVSSFFQLGAGDCGPLPSQVKKAFSEAQHFTNTCATARLAPGKRIAINDYSGDGPPRMYVFNQEGKCIRAMPISWGVGSDRSGRMEACSTDNSKKTPPGFHITARHLYGSRYNDNNSIGLAGLCGQNSLGDRGILIHGAANPGTASSWGCTGVPFSEFQDLKELLGVGSLVYNYFGDTPSRNCSDNSGFEPRCDPEPLAVNAAAQASGGRAKYNYRTKSGGGGSYGGSGGSESDNRGSR